MRERLGRAGTAALCVGALLLGSCAASKNQASGSTPGLRSFGDSSDLEDKATPAANASSVPRSIPGTKVSSAPTIAPRASAAARTAGPARTFPPRFADRGVTGQNATLYIRKNVPKLIVELGAVEGKQPAQETIEFLKATLASVLDKPGGIEFRLTDTWPAEKDAYTGEDLETLEEEHRQTHSTTEAASMYLLFLNGQLKDVPALGVAYKGSNIVILTDQVQRATVGLSRVPFEKAVVLHEMGHLLGLVNLAWQSPRDHEDKVNDPAKHGHSKNKESVMYYAVESLSVATIFRGGPPNKFDADDLADLADAKAGRLGGP
jgi:hypothetical protein